MAPTSRQKSPFLFTQLVRIFVVTTTTTITTTKAAAAAQTITTRTPASSNGGTDTGTHTGNGSDWRELFRSNGIKPDVIREVPKSLLGLRRSQDGRELKAGSTVSFQDIEKEPLSHFDADPDKLYSLFVLNPDVPSREDAYDAEWQHMAVFNIPGNKVKEGDVVIEYSPIYPNKLGKGLQRMTFLVYEQKVRIATQQMDHFDKDHLDQGTGGTRGGFYMKPFVYKVKLKARPLAGTFVYVLRKKDKADKDLLADRGQGQESLENEEGGARIAQKRTGIAAPEEEGRPKLFSSKSPRAENEATSDPSEMAIRGKGSLLPCASKEECEDSEVCVNNVCRNQEPSAEIPQESSNLSLETEEAYGNLIDQFASQERNGELPDEVTDKVLLEEGKPKREKSDKNIFKYPLDCDESKLGSCNYLAKWSKTGNPGEVRFEVQSKNPKWTALGFSHSKHLIGADVISITKKGTIGDRHVNEKKEVVLDPSRNVIGPEVTFTDGVLIGRFSKQLKTDDPRHDLDLGVAGGVFLFAPGIKELGQKSSYVFKRRKVDFSEFKGPEPEDIQESQEQTTIANSLETTGPKLGQPKESIETQSLEEQIDDPTEKEFALMKGKEEIEPEILEELTPAPGDITEKYSEEITMPDGEGHNDTKESSKETSVEVLEDAPLSVVSGQSNIVCDDASEGTRFMLPLTFAGYQLCRRGKLLRRNCPQSSMFYFKIQCCVKFGKFPCLENCLK